MTDTYLSFNISNVFFAINVEKVLEVLEQQEIKNLPNAPKVVRGIINFRGEAVPVIETRIKFNFPVREANSSFVIIIMELKCGNESFRIAAIVDKVKDVIEISDNQIMPVPIISKEYSAEYYCGVVKLNNEFILLLNAENVFSNIEISQVNFSESYLS